MQNRSIIVRADWDAEAGVWVATTEDICGLAIEAPTLDLLRDRVMGALLDLVEENGLDTAPSRIPVHIMAQQTLMVRRVA